MADDMDMVPWWPRKAGRGYGAFGGPGKRGGNKKEPLDAVDCQGCGGTGGLAGVQGPSPLPPRLLVGGREDGR